jgi:hypothetical protein
VIDRAAHDAAAREARWILILYVVSSAILPLLVGTLSGSYLLAAVAFGVWTSIFTIAFGIVFSRRAAAIPTQRAATPTMWTLARNPQVDAASVSDDPAMAAWVAYRDEEGTRPRPGSHLSNGWLLPRRVTLRPDPPAAVKASAAAQVMRAAWAAFGLAVLGAILGLSFSGLHGDAAAIGLMALEVAVYDFIVLLFTRRSVRIGMPRPTLDRPATVYNVFLPVVVIALFIMTGALGSDEWSLPTFLAFVAILGSICANVWWFIESAQRWNLTYEIVDVETNSL